MSLANNLYNLGALLKTNLETKGVTGLTGNEGLTTLANKILDIQTKPSEKMFVVVTGNSFTLGSSIMYNGQVDIDWGDGIVETNVNPNNKTHTYTDGSNHIICVTGEIYSLGSSFYRCSGLISVILPNSVTSLNNNCFSSCSNLTSVSLSSSLNMIGGSCFFGCSRLTNVIIPDSVTNLGQSCFTNCSGLTSVTIPNSITNIGGFCFYGCSNLVDYELYWTGEDIIAYSSDKMATNANTVFTIPYGSKSDYIAAGYPSSKLVERENGDFDFYIEFNENTDITNYQDILAFDGDFGYDDDSHIAINSAQLILPQNDDLLPIDTMELTIKRMNAVSPTIISYELTGAEAEISDDITHKILLTKEGLYCDGIKVYDHSNMVEELPGIIALSNCILYDLGYTLPSS